MTVEARENGSAEDRADGTADAGQQDRVDSGDEDRSAAARSAAEILRALGHPLRIRLVEALVRGPHCVHELVDATGAHQVLVSQHLRVLRATRTVRGTRRGKEIEYSLVDDHVGHIVTDAVSHALEVLRTDAPVASGADRPAPDGRSVAGSRARRSAGGPAPPA